MDLHLPTLPRKLIAGLAAIVVTLAVAGPSASQATTSTPASTPATKPATKSAAKVAPAKPKLPVVVKSVGDGVVEVRDVSRIVALNGDVNEILYALGLGDNVVANDITAYFPDESTKKTKIGYGRTLSAEGILAQRPTLIIGNTDAGPASTIAQLRSSGVAVVIVASGDDVADAPKKIRAVGDAVGLSGTADVLADRVYADIRAVQKRWSTAANRYEPRAAFLYLRGPRTQLLGGSGTRANAMLLGAGAIDAAAFFANVSGYVPITSESLVLANPDVIVVLNDGLASVGGVEGLMKVPGVSLTKAGKSKRIVSFDDLKLLELGPRTAEALDELSTALYAKSK